MACEEFYDTKKKGLTERFIKDSIGKRNATPFRSYCTRCYVRRTQILIPSFDIVGKWVGWTIISESRQFTIYHGLYTISSL